MLPDKVTPKKAASYFKDRVDLPKDEFEALDTWSRKRAFTVARMTKAEMIADIRLAVQRAIRLGQSVEDFKADLSALFEARGWQGPTPWHADTIFRTNVQAAYGAGRLDALRESGVEFWRYQTLRDNRVRRTHRELHGLTYRADSSFWQTRYPPWEYNCRCYVTGVKNPKHVEPDTVPPPPSQTGFSTVAVDTRYLPDPHALLPRDLADAVQRDISRRR